MPYQNGQEKKSTRVMVRKRRRSALWIGVIGVVFVIVLGILLQNSKTLEIIGVGILLLLLLLRVAPGIIDNQGSKKIKEEKGEILGTEHQQNIDEPPDGLPEAGLDLDGKEANNTK
jgi:hypothetical protein